MRRCFAAAHWTVSKKEVDDNTWGDGTVLNQFPAPGTDVDPKDPGKIQLNVSSGNPA